MVKQYFAACEPFFSDRQAQLRRISLALCRGGVERMEELCQIYTQTPERLMEIRSIGTKSLPLIGQVCRRYQRMGAEDGKQ